MDCCEIMSASADYIEEHLKEELSVAQLAAAAGFSPFHYCRLFALYEGAPVMEYIRRRRLAQAASELCAGRHILDVALDYGFETHSGFTKAFRKVYGYPPDEYRRRVEPHRPPAPNPIAGICETDGPFAPQFRLERREGFYIAGLILRTSPDLSSVAQQPALWQEFRLLDADNKIYAKARPREHGEYNICFPVDTGLFRHVNGVKITDPGEVDGGLYVDWVPPALCGIFSPPPTFGPRSKFADNIVATWKYIYSVWLPASGYALDAHGLDYEFYDARCHGDGPYSMDICVPLIETNSNREESKNE